MSDYSGVGILRKDNGDIFAVKVANKDGHTSTMFPHIYEKLKCQPPLAKLPDQKAD